MMDGAEKVIMDPLRGSQQYGRMLEALAVAEARGYTPLSELLQNEGRRMGRHTTCVIITSSTDPEWVTSLGLLLQQGARAAVVLLDPATFGDEDAEPPPTDGLAAAGVVTYVVRGQSDISLMLGPAGIVGDEVPERQMAGVR
jgi:N-acyl-D-aspartate/D-glutamate deacylase